ncbi:probable protein phosphatase 2C 57 isoform X2 [Dioscorea cayenensis subsp. rotundata]|uniref:protein-serine/threonine phosphatase n=1 Tax=Dioscorea cayennensis subsp. rotundata TaxID=55577 RepID=A0AB40BE56_DIOCR|nr:probable protein phosphatase 2C 57 isoform X2 [Dioscorea cayenensis subsp. rotundata]
MAGNFGGGEDGGSSGDGKPPNPLSGGGRLSFGGGNGSSPRLPTLARHASLTKKKVGVSFDLEDSRECCDSEYIPVVRSGGWSDIGFRQSMEDTFVCCDDFMHDYGLKKLGPGPNAFYGTDTAFADACSADSALASGTTALAALIIGRSLVVANAGDCRAVLCRRGKAIEMSRDHKPACSVEKKRIEASGGYIYDGYLNGLLNVARAIGDWHMEGLKDRNGMGPLSAVPEVMQVRLTNEDEFLIIGCDGVWDVFRSQNAVDFARRKLQEHNDPAICCKELVDEALKRKTGDNLSVIVVCFSSSPPPALSVPRARVQRSISAEGLKELQGFLDSLAN